MATLTSKGVTSTALQITSEVAGKKFIALPKRLQHIIENRNKHDEFMLSLTRRLPVTTLTDNGEVPIYLYPKSDDSFDILTTLDSATGKINGGYLGAQGTGLFGYVEPEITHLARVTLPQGTEKAVKLIIMNKDVVDEEGMMKMTEELISNYFNSYKEKEIKIVKAAISASIGEVGIAAKNEGFAAVSVPRLLSKDYPITEAGGVSAIIDIKAALQAKEKIGSNDGTGIEVNYPFARGVDALNSSTLMISPDLDTAILLAIRGSYVGYFPGVGNKGKTISEIFGMKVIIGDLPQKAGKKFNWAIIETGRNGAIAIGTQMPYQWEMDPNYAGLKQKETILSAANASEPTINYVQPELNFGSFGA